MSRIRTLLVVCCARAADSGGDRRLRRRRRASSSEDPQTVLDETFNNDDQGHQRRPRPQRIGRAPRASRAAASTASLSGPFQGDPDEPERAPAARLDRVGARARAPARASTSRGGLVITDDNAYVEYNDQAYEVGTEHVRPAAATRSRPRPRRPRRRGAGLVPRSMRAGDRAGRAAIPPACDIDFASWLTNLTNEGTEDVGGTETVHISGDADVETDPRPTSATSRRRSRAPRASGFDPSQLEPGLGRGHRRLDRRLLGRRRQHPAQARGQPDDRPVGDRRAASRCRSANITISFSVEIAGAQRGADDRGPGGREADQRAARRPRRRPRRARRRLGGARRARRRCAAARGGGGTTTTSSACSGASTPEEINACASQL